MRCHELFDHLNGAVRASVVDKDDLTTERVLRDERFELRRIDSKPVSLIE
jgi:hypothetical protein